MPCFRPTPGRAPSGGRAKRGSAAAARGPSDDAAVPRCDGSRAVNGLHPDVPSKPPQDREFDEPGAWALKPIAILKLLRAATLVATAILVRGIVDAAWGTRLHALLDRLAFDDVPLLSAFAQRIVQTIDTTSTRRLELFGAAGLAYAVVLLVEASGLWKGRHWAEHLTSAVTVVLLPFELVLLAHQRTPLRIAALVVNLAILGHLGWRLVQRIRQKSGRRG